MSPILGIWASQNYSRYSLPTSYESIATVNVGAGGATDVTFSSIPSTYTHLQLRLTARTTIAGSASDGIYVQFNGSTSSIYSFHRIVGSGSSVSTAAASSNTETYIDRITGGLALSNTYGVAVTDILDYANTNKFKTIRSLGGWDDNGNGVVTFSSGSWQSTNAITSIKLYLFSNGFAQYSSIALYGIKGA